MKSEDFERILQEVPRPESEKERQWFEKLVATGRYSSMEEARIRMQKLFDSVTSLESSINQLIGQKIAEITELGDPLVDDVERERVIIQRLSEIFQERPELLTLRGSDLLHPDEEKLILHAEEKETYNFMQRALRALAEKYEENPLRKGFSLMVLDANLARQHERARAVLFEGEPSWFRETVYDCDKLRESSYEREEMLPKARALLQELTMDNIKDVKKRLAGLIAESIERIRLQYPYLRDIEHQLSHRYEETDKARRLAVHVAVTSTLFDVGILNANKRAKLCELLIPDILEAQRVMESLACIEDEKNRTSHRPRSGLGSKNPEEALTEQDLEDLFGDGPREFQRELLGKTIEAAQQRLVDRLKSL